jgi:hypothetical protein
MKAPQERDKYLNEVDQRLNEEFSDVICEVRGCLERFFTSLLSGKQRLSDLALADELEPLITSHEDLPSNLWHMQPRPALFEDVSRLLGGGKETIMGDKYEIHGQAAGVGRNVKIHTVNFNQIWNESGSSLNLAKLADDLARLRDAMAKESTSAEQFAAVGNVASAEVEARKEQGPTTLEYLSKAGRWALDVATKIGVPVAIEALKKAVGQ